MERRLLVVDDEPEIRGLLREIFEDEGYAVEVAANAAEARTAVFRRAPDVVLLDIWMPDEDGVSLLKQWNTNGTPAFSVIMMSGHGTVETAVEAIRQGAFDYIEKPLSMERLLVTVRRALDARRPASGSKGLSEEGGDSQLIGSSPVMRGLREQARRLAMRHDRLLICGEPGAGRHALMRYIHAASPRRNGPVVDLSEARWASVLHLDEAHDSANGPDEVIRVANGGLLCLGELLHLSPQEQLQLLRLLEGVAWPSVDVRVMALIDEDREPADLVKEGRLAQGLAAWFGASCVHVPALRHHGADVPELLQYHAERLQRTEHLRPRPFSAKALNRLRRYDWPGNVAELIELLRVLLSTGAENEIDVPGVDEALERLGQRRLAASYSLNDALFQLPLKEARELFERAYLLYWLDQTNGNISRLAEQSGVDRTHLYRKLRALGLDPRLDRHKR